MVYSDSTRILFALFIFLSTLQQAISQIDKLRVSCEKYLVCRHELEEKYWQCSNKARAITQYTCKSEHLLREFYDDIIHREKYLYRCYSKENYSFQQHKDCQLTETWVSSESCTADSFSNHQLTCRKLKECCPHINRCFHKEYFKLLTMHLKEKRETTLKNLYTCTSGLSKVISANISSEDTQIAVDVMKLNEVVIATVADMGLLKKKKLSSRIRMTEEKTKISRGVSRQKAHGIPLLDGNSYVHELNNGTALLKRLESDSVGTKEQTNKEIPRSYRHRSQLTKNYPSEPDRNINYNNQNRLYGQSRKLEQLSRGTIQNRPFTIRRPWSSDRKVATKRKIGQIREIKTIKSQLLPVKSKHELKIRPLSTVQDFPRQQKPSLHVENRYEEQVLEPTFLKRYNGLERQIIHVLSTTERLPPTSVVYSEESEEDFESSLQRKSSSLVQFAKNAIPLPIRNSINIGGTGPNESDNEMEVVVDGGTWTMIPKVSTTFSPTQGSPLENFIEQEKLNAADIRDISTQLPLLIEKDKLTRVHVLPRSDTSEPIAKQTKKFPDDKFSGNFWSHSRHHRVFGTRLHPNSNIPDVAELIKILRNPQGSSHCELAKTCRKLYSMEKSNCAATSEDFSLPGVPKRLRFSKCITVLTPQYEQLKNMTREVDSTMERCLSLKIGKTVGVCSSDVPALPNFNNLLECSNRVLFLNLHCEKLSSCCSSSSECHKIVNDSEAYRDMRSKKQELFQKSQKCQLKSLRKFNIRRASAKH